MTIGNPPTPGRAAAARLPLTGPDDGIALVRWFGEIDIGSTRELERELDGAQQSEARRVVLDLEAVTFIDSMGMRTVLLAQQRAHERGQDLVLRNVPAEVRRVFRLAGIEDFLTIDE